MHFLDTSQHPNLPHREVVKILHVPDNYLRQIIIFSRDIMTDDHTGHVRDGFLKSGHCLFRVVVKHNAEKRLKIET